MTCNSAKRLAPIRCMMWLAAQNFISRPIFPLAPDTKRKEYETDYQSRDDETLHRFCASKCCHNAKDQDKGDICSTDDPEPGPLRKKEQVHRADSQRQSSTNRDHKDGRLTTEI